MSFLWKGDKRLVFFADVGGNESFFIGSTDLKGKRVVRIVESQIYERLNSSAGGMVSGLRFDEDRVLVSGMFVSSTRGRVSSGSTTDNPVVAKVNVKNRGLSTVYSYSDNEIVTGVVSDDAGIVRAYGG